jgi:hypothetical protein
VRKIYFVPLLFVSIFLILNINAMSFAQTEEEYPEPSYCDPDHFSKFEITPASSNGSNNSSKILRLRVFRLGEVVIAGMGIGKSPTNLMKNLVLNYSPKADQVNYCTWFFGSANNSAEKAFNYRPIPGTVFLTLDFDNVPKNFLKILYSSFIPSPSIPPYQNFISCVENENFIGLGCNNQQHRGPTVFGMILAFSGCSPRHATEIANNIWGLNGVPYFMRLSVSQAGYDLGKAHPKEREALAKKFSSQTH